ncbi:MAG: hypothetical protein HPY66_0034 [Firmicutes bacterium]|nr:hypothetical protein [Bacillota bacterium]
MFSLLGERFEITPVGNHELERHLVYRLDKGRRLPLILKLFFKKNRWNREVASLKTLAGSRVKCPELKGYGVLDDGTEWLITEYMNGEIFFNVKDSIDLDNRASIYEQMGEELGKLHSFKDFDFFGNWDEECKSLDYSCTYSEVFIRRAEMTINNLLGQCLPEHKIHKRAAEVIRQNYRKVSGVEKAVLCHNDYDERNVLVSRIDGEWRVEGIIDFEQSLPWDRDRDIVELYYSLLIEGSGLEQAFLKGYNRYSAIEESFFEKMGYYLLCAGVNICSWSYGIAPDYYHRGMELIRDFLERV